MLKDGTFSGATGRSSNYEPSTKRLNTALGKGGRLITGLGREKLNINLLA